MNNGYILDFFKEKTAIDPEFFLNSILEFIYPELRGHDQLSQPDESNWFFYDLNAKGRLIRAQMKISADSIVIVREKP